MILITESTRFILGVNVISQSYFSKKVKSQTKKGREMVERSGTNRDTHNTFTEFRRRYKVAHK